MRFTARYPGYCAQGDHRFTEGDPIGYDADGQRACADCLNGLTTAATRQTRRETAPPCPACFLIGPCDCETPC